MRLSLISEGLDTHYLGRDNRGGITDKMLNRNPNSHLIIPPPVVSANQETHTCKQPHCVHKFNVPNWLIQSDKDVLSCPKCGDKQRPLWLHPNYK